MLCAAIATQAQILKVTSVTPLQVNQDKDKVMQAVAISPLGDYLMLTSDTKQGLIKWDLNTGTATTVTSDQGAGSDVLLSSDGQQVLYGEITYKDRRRQQTVKAVDLLTGKKQTLVKATRQVQGFAFDGGNAAIVTTDGNIQKHALKKGAAQAPNRPVLSRHHLKLYVTRDGKTSLLAPNGEDQRYIWGSLSPNGNRVLYHVSGYGTFVCDIDGSHVIPMGNITAPKWWDDNTIVGMDETDDEYSIIASSIVVRTLDGMQQVLTGEDVIATYPLPCAQAGKIAFSTPNGQIYLLTVEK